ncbi:MAG: DEAD/DEAH box helicase [bacterium]|nr:DEAD/DEAH box helicase [bacterium]
MDRFEAFKLPAKLEKSLACMQFTKPTPIQSAVIPTALEGKDILGCAQTGTGKTAAFGIPISAKLMRNPQGAALVLTPTRELAVQVLAQIKDILGKESGIRTALLIGGEPMPKQYRQLDGKPRLIVGTPGRINDHLERGTLKLSDCETLVLDETDRMLDMGFTIQIDRILKHLSGKRQTLLFSATLPRNIVNLSKKYLNDPSHISVGSTMAPAENIKQEIIRVSESEKYQKLLDYLTSSEGSVIIFSKTKYGAAKMAVRLSKAGHSADALHRDLRQNKRDRVTGAFRKSKFRVLVATDVASRGLDIPHIEHVINYDLPQCPEDYIHRIGRTARAGREGTAVCFLAPSDNSKWRAIERLLNPGAARSEGHRKGESSRGGGDWKKKRGPRKPFNSDKKRSFNGSDSDKKKPFGGERKRSFNDSDSDTKKSFGGDKKKTFSGAKNKPFNKGKKFSKPGGPKSEGFKKKAA